MTYTHEEIEEKFGELMGMYKSLGVDTTIYTLVYVRSRGYEVTKPSVEFGVSTVTVFGGIKTARDMYHSLRAAIDSAQEIRYSNNKKKR